jgi:hypothetical protein
MRRLLVILALASAAATARAAEVTTASGTREMIFVFHGLSDLGLSGYNSGLGLRYFIRDGLALRPALGFGWSRTRTHPDQSIPKPRPSDAREIDTSVSLELALEKHLPGPRSVSPYVGASLYGLYTNNKTYPHLAADAPSGAVTKVTTKETDGSLLGLLGFEWALTDAITLGAETRLGLTITTGQKETEAVLTHDRLSNDTAEWSVGFRTTSLFLGVRW